jgi:hypothetical protein
VSEPRTANTRISGVTEGTAELIDWEDIGKELFEESV